MTDEDKLLEGYITLLQVGDRICVEDKFRGEYRRRYYGNIKYISEDDTIYISIYEVSIMRLVTFPVYKNQFKIEYIGKTPILIADISNTNGSTTTTVV